jgi:Spy/CpxP family protein refolding chaperone
MKLNRRQTISGLASAVVLSVGVSAAQSSENDESGDSGRDGSRHDGSRHGGSGRDRPSSAFLAQFDLTDEQIAEIRALVEEMRADGASREEIHEAVREKLLAFGVTEAELEAARPPASAKRFRGRPGGAKGRKPPRDPTVEGLTERFELTEAEAETVVAEVTRMREAGASPREIHARVRDLLESYGVDVPKDGPRGPPPRGLIEES